MSLEELQEFIASELFAVQGERKTLEANKWPDVQATAAGVDTQAIVGIVEDILKEQGFHRVDKLFDPASGRMHYGRIESDHSVTYLKIKWEIDESVFNPYKDIEALEIPVLSGDDLPYLTGLPLGTTSAGTSPFTKSRRPPGRYKF